jgi:hypothetical protein
VTPLARMTLSTEDLQELVALFISPTVEERDEAYNPTSRFYFRKQDLAEEYSLTQERREFAFDSWRAVTYFLHRHGYELAKDGLRFDLGKSSGYTSATRE